MPDQIKHLWFLFFEIYVIIMYSSKIQMLHLTHFVLYIFLFKYFCIAGNTLCMYKFAYLI